MNPKNSTALRLFFWELENLLEPRKEQQGQVNVSQSRTRAKELHLLALMLHGQLTGRYFLAWGCAVSKGCRLLGMPPVCCHA